MAEAGLYQLATSPVRTKLEPDARRPRYIETVRGVGYRFPASS